MKGTPSRRARSLKNFLGPLLRKAWPDEQSGEKKHECHQIDVFATHQNRSNPNPTMAVDDRKSAPLERRTIEWKWHRTQPPEISARTEWKATTIRITTPRKLFSAMLDLEVVIWRRSYSVWCYRRHLGWRLTLSTDPAALGSTDFLQVC